MYQISEQAQAVLQKLETAGYEAYLVGGCVRDLLLGKTPDDWDITTSAKPEETMTLFGEQAVATGLQHGTVTVVMAHKHMEVTTYRTETTYGDFRHPDAVHFTSSLEEDLARRDFTVNAIAMDLRGTLIDPFGGREDLENGVLRCVGAPEKRFSEDALRMMRALRFSSVLGFELETETARAIHAHCTLLENIAMERLRVELLKLLCGQDVVRILLEFSDVLGVFMPEILPSVGCDQKNFHHIYDVWEHIVRTVGYIRPDPVLRMTMLLHDLGKPYCMTIDAEGVGHFRGHAESSCELGHDILTRLRFDTESAHRILTLVKWHDVPVEETERAVRKLLNKLGVQAVRDLFEVKRADNLAQAPEFLGRQQQIDRLEAILKTLLEQDACFSLKHLAVNGNDLKELGLSGREIGQMLEQLLNLVLEDQLPNERDVLLNQAKQFKN